MIPASEFYQKMATYGLVPNLKFIEDIIAIIYFNKPKKIVTHNQKDKSPGTALTLKKHNNNSNEEFSNTTLSMLGASMRADSPIARLGYQASFSPRKSNRSNRGMHRDATLTTTLASAAGRLGVKDDGICRRIKLENFKAIYGHGLNVKFVKLLFLLLKKQVPRFIEYINIQAKTVSNT